MPTVRIERKGKAINGGLNDTPFPDSRLPNQAKTQTNFKINPDDILEKVGGRKFFDAGKTISGATKPANPCVITATAHGFSNGGEVYIYGVVGMTELNGNTYTVAGAAADTFQLSGTDSSGYTAYTSGGTAVKLFADTIRGINCPPRRIPIVTITSQNKALYVRYGGIAITAITKANPGVITAAGHGLGNGDTVFLGGIGGMSQLNGATYTVAGAAADTFNVGVDTSGYDAYTSGGYCFLDAASYTTINLTEQNYYSAAELALELQTQLNADTNLSGFTVTVSGDIFTITSGTAGYVVLCFHHANTTLDGSLFGFRQSQALANAGSVISTIGGTGHVGNPNYTDIPNQRFVFTSSKIYNEDFGEEQIASAGVASAQTPAGIWDGTPPKWYGCTGAKNIIRRGNSLYNALPDPEAISVAGKSGGEIRVFDPMDVGGAARIHFIDNTAGTQNLHSATNQNTYRTLTKDNREIWMEFNPFSGTNGIANFLRVYLDNASGEYDFKLRFYCILPELDYSELIKEVDGKDIGTGGGATFDIDDIPWYCPKKLVNLLPLNPEYNAYIKIELLPVSTGAGVNPAVRVYGQHSAAGTDSMFQMDENGVMQDVGITSYLVIQCVQINVAGANDVFKYKVTMINKDGYESEASEEFSYVPTAGNHLFRIQLMTPINNGYDIEYVRLYRTEVNGSVFYKVADIHHKLIELDIDHFPILFGGSGYNWMLVWDSLLDRPSANGLIEQIEDVSPASATSNLLYKHAIKWKGSLFAAGVPGYEDFLYWSGVDTPESFNISDVGDWIKIGKDGSPITGLAGAADRLVVFKENGFWLVYPSGDVFAVDSLNDDGIGTVSHWSCVAVITRQGVLVFFQGPDGHFYATQGIDLIRLSEGRLDTFVSGLNKSKYDQTVGVLNVETNEIMWSVCTGSNTTPDKSITYNITKNAWHEEDANFADVWAHDRINSSYPGRTLLMGAASKVLFYAREDAANLGLDITDTYEDADLDYGGAEEKKGYVSCEVSAYSQTAGQQITLYGYKNGSATAIRTAGKTHDLTTSPAKYKTGMKGRGLTFRRKITNSDQSGWVRINRIVDELQPVRGLRKAS